MISRETIEKVRDTAQIEEVVGEFVNLKKRGSSLMGLCPFHDEKTPSFHVSISKGIFKCFGCGEGGDSLSFVMKHEKYSYPEAIRFLAEKYNIEVEETERSPEQIAAQDKKESLYVINQWAKDFFVKNLWDSQEGKSIGLPYFKERGYGEEVIKKFELGYSPDKWSALVDAAKSSGYALHQVREVGLSVEKKDESHYDRFRDRMIFPIHSLSGRILGFGGRTLKTEKNVPKYVNSPESEIYNKSKVLYGLHFARKKITQEDVAYLVEGYADVLSMHQSGIENVVSSSGTSLTQGQIRLMARYTKNIVLLFDGDEAGIKAALRGSDLLLEEGMNVKVLLFPEGDDPDLYIKKHGSSAFQDFLNTHSEDFIPFKTRILLQEAGEDPIKKAATIRDIVSSIAKVPDQIKSTLFIRQSSSLLDMEERVLLAELNKMKMQQARTQAARQQSEKPQKEEAEGAEKQEAYKTSSKESLLHDWDSEKLIEREIVRILLNYGSENASWEETDIPIAPWLLGSIEDISFVDPPSKEIVTCFRKDIKEYKIPEAKQFFSHQNEKVVNLAIDCVANKYELSEKWNDEKRQIYVSQETDHLKELVIQAVYRIKKKKVQIQIDDVREELKTVENNEDLDILLSKYQKLKEVEKGLGEFLGNTIVK